MTNNTDSSVQESYYIDKELEEVRDLEGRGTELVSLYIPAGKSLNPYTGKMQEEHAQADNIKSDRTRKSVQSALSKVSDVLKRYNQTPENGLVVFAGRSNGDMVEYVFDDLPRPLTHSDYICSDHFVTEPLEKVVSPDDSYGLLVLDRNEAAIGELVGERIITLTTLESGVMGKSKAGGQSQSRFENIREEQKENFFKKVASNAKGHFVEGDELSVDGILVGGTDITVDDFLSGEHLDYRIRDGVIGDFNISYGNEQGLEELVNKAEDVLQGHKEESAKKYVDRFWSALSDEDDPVTYGEEEVRKALEYGAVNDLLLSEELNPKKVEELSELCENQGGNVVIVPTGFEKGEAFWRTFEGIGAILRYRIE